MLLLFFFLLFYFVICSCLYMPHKFPPSSGKTYLILKKKTIKQWVFKCSCQLKIMNITFSTVSCLFLA